MMNKGGQLTIFIIVGILIVVGIALFFFLSTDLGKEIIGRGETNPETFLKSCIEDKTKESVFILSEQGGYIENPLNISFMFEGEGVYKEISYLCYNEFVPGVCLVLEGDLKGHLESEIKTYIEKDVITCFDELIRKKEKEADNVRVRYEEGDFEVDLESGKIIIDINGELDLTKSGESFILQDFKIIITSGFYELQEVVQQILSDLVTGQCDISNAGDYSNPKVKVNPYLEITQTKENNIDYISFYTLVHKETGERFRFAVKNCVPY